MSSQNNHNVRAYKGISPNLGEGVYIDPAAVVIGDVVLGKDSSVWPLAVIRGDVNSIHIGERCSIQDGTVIHVSRRTPNNPEGYAVSIGNDVTVGHKVILHGCTISDQVLVGMGATVLDNAVVEKQVIIGAGALVTPGKRLQSGYLYTGSPARQARPLTTKEIEYFVETAHNYALLKNDYRDEPKP